jgi:26S proteasome regulatory subunit N1
VLKNKFVRYLSLGLALLFIGQQENVDATLETLKVVPEEISKGAIVLVEICAYAGTGNVLKIQSMLHYCNDHLDLEKENGLYQSFAVLGIALIAMGEDIGMQMAIRQYNHLMHYGEANIRRMVPLALGLLYCSYPQMNVLDLLSKYSHDNDAQVAINAIFAMGLAGSGTNNARLAQMLRQLASYYHKDSNCLFMVRIAQGLVHLGKGTMTLSPFHSGRSLMALKSVAALLTTLVSFTELNNSIFI